MAAPQRPFASRTTVPAVDFHMTELPKLHPHVHGKGLMEGVKAFDAEMSEWKRSNERLVSEQFAKIASAIPK